MSNNGLLRGFNRGGQSNYKMDVYSPTPYLSYVSGSPGAELEFLWSKPAWADTIEILCIGGGGGGGAGALGAAATIRLGGAGGGGGGISWQTYQADDVPDHCRVTVGGGGRGGYPQNLNTTDSTQNGLAGGLSHVQGFGQGGSNQDSLCLARGGSEGYRGQVVSSSSNLAFTSTGGNGTIDGGAGGIPKMDGAAGGGSGGQSGSTSGGGSGGSINVANTASAGDAATFVSGRGDDGNSGAAAATGGAHGWNYGTYTASWGDDGASGRRHQIQTQSPSPVPGMGGGGGGAHASTPGDGGFGGRGAGGGGGGAGTTGSATASGAGGPGGDGIVVIKSWG